MATLRRPPSRLSAAPSRFARASETAAPAPIANPLRHLYNTARWRRLRWAVLVRDLFTCQMCGRLEGNTALLVADHAKPHRGREALFWDADNLRCVCKPCHDGEKQRQEQGSRHTAGDWGLSPEDADRAGVAGYLGTQASSGRMARPSWFRKVHVPLTVVCGPPGGGKSTWVRDHAGPNDLVICFDQLATTLFGKDGGSRSRLGLTLDQKADVLRVRNERLGDLMRAKAAGRWPRAWLILTEPKAEHRAWWARTLGASVLVLATPASVCAQRIARDHQAGDDRGAEITEAVTAWWNDYRPAPCDRTVTP